jgi:hypothetical protein
MNLYSPESMDYNRQMKLYSPGCIDNNTQMKLYSPESMDNNRQMKLYYPGCIDNNSQMKLKQESEPVLPGSEISPVIDVTEGEYTCIQFILYSPMASWRAEIPHPVFVVMNMY